MAIPSSTPPDDVSPGFLKFPRFMGRPIVQLKRVSLELLTENIISAPEGVEGLEEAREIVARRARETMDTFTGGKNQLSLDERIIGVKKCVDTILLCRPFLSPAVFSRVKDFVEDEGKGSHEVSSVRAILQDQAKLQDIVLQHGHLTSRKKTTDFSKEICDLVEKLKKLPKKIQPTRLIELLEKPETAKVTWRHISSHFQALKKNPPKKNGDQDDQQVA